MLLSYQQWQMWIHKNQNPWDALCATVTLSIINITQFTPEFIYTITYLCIVFSAVGWIWSRGWWSKYLSIKLILIIEDSHYAPIRHVEGLSGRGCLKLTRDSWIIDTGSYLINWAGLSSVNKQPPESEHAHLNAADLYGENVAWIDHTKTHFHSIKATDKWDCSGWKLNYPIYSQLFGQFWLKCEELANTRLGEKVDKNCLVFASANTKIWWTYYKSTSSAETSWSKVTLYIWLLVEINDFHFSMFNLYLKEVINFFAAAGIRLINNLTTWMQKSILFTVISGTKTHSVRRRLTNGITQQSSMSLVVQGSLRREDIY